MTRSKKILLVEDSQDDIDLTLRAFARHNLANEILVARDGQEALDLLLGRGASAGRELRPELVLLDLKLPKIDGLDILRRMRGEEQTRRIPVVVLTSSNEERDIVASYDLGANSFVRKPVDFGEFVEASRQLGLYWLVLNQPVPPREGGAP